MQLIHEISVALSCILHSVETVLKMCGLEKFADAIVGSLNVELRKRTTIGVELAAKVHMVLFLS